jgi:HAMP domain-containing protein
MKLTIARKLGIGAAVTLILMGAAIVANLIGLDTVRASSNESVSQVQAAANFENLVQAQSQSFFVLYKYVAEGQQKDLASFQEARSAVNQLGEPAMAYCARCHPSVAPSIKDTLDSLNRQRASSMSLLDEALATYQSSPGNSAEASAKLAQAERLIQSQMDVADTVRASHASFVQDQIAAASRQARSLLITNVVLGALAILISAAVTIGVSLGIVRSVRQLRGAAEDISRGDMDAPIEVKTGDEMEDMAKSIERMRASLKAAIERLRSRQGGAA